MFANYDKIFVWRFYIISKKKKIVFIINPVSKRYSKIKIKRAVAFLKEKDFSSDLIFTSKASDGIAIAKEVSKIAGIYAVVAAGGDGTFNEVANGLIGSGVPMAILPMGTANVLAKELCISEIPERALLSLEKFPISVKPSHISSLKEERFFLLMAGLGFDAYCVKNANKTIKKVSGKFAYILSGVVSLLNYESKPFKIMVDDKIVEGSNLIVCNASSYGGKFKMAKDANIKDNSFYVVIFKGNKKIDIIRYIFGVLRGRHTQFQDVIYKKAKLVKIENPCHIQVDGDYLCEDAVEIKKSSSELLLFC